MMMMMMVNSYRFLILHRVWPDPSLEPDQDRWLVFLSVMIKESLSFLSLITSSSSSRTVRTRPSWLAEPAAGLLRPSDQNKKCKQNSNMWRKTRRSFNQSPPLWLVDLSDISWANQLQVKMRCRWTNRMKKQVRGRRREELEVHLPTGGRGGAPLITETERANQKTGINFKLLAVPRRASYTSYHSKLRLSLLKLTKF